MVLCAPAAAEELELAAIEELEEADDETELIEDDILVLTELDEETDSDDDEASLLDDRDSLLDDKDISDDEDEDCPKTGCPRKSMTKVKVIHFI